jgi:4-amino-4-deoxy-L-arabinose transferase-like glycosyltransferase
MPIGILLAGLAVVFLFFLGLNYYSTQWANRTYVELEKNIFFVSFIVRLIFVGYLYLLTYWFSPGSFPFEINAADSWVYHNVTIEMADAPIKQWSDIIEKRMKGQSDYGYPIYQGFVYSIFGPYTFIIRFLNAIMGSLTVLMIGRIVNLSWGSNHAKMSAIVAMLFPTLIWYCGIQLKETLMVFILVGLFYLIWKARSEVRLKLQVIVICFLLCFILFFFRTFLAFLVLISLLLFFIPLNQKRLGTGWLISLMLGLYLFYSLGVANNIFNDVNNQIADSEDFFSRNLENEKSLLGNVKFDQVALAPLIVIGAAITPFPSYLDTEARQLSIFSRFQNDLVRNMMYFFMYFGLYQVLKKKFKEYLAIVFFFLAYLGVITSAANSFQARFHMPIIPFAIIFIGVGIAEYKAKHHRNWLIYLILIFIAQLSWTYFKLNIRGIDA